MFYTVYYYTPPITLLQISCTYIDFGNVAAVQKWSSMLWSWLDDCNDCNYWDVSQLDTKCMCKSFLQSQEQRFQSQCKCMKLEAVYGHAYNLMGVWRVWFKYFWNRGSLRAMCTASHRLSTSPRMAIILDIQPS